MENQNIINSADSVVIESAHVHSHSHAKAEPKKYINPYMAGIGLGVVLFLTFIFMGRGIGASGAVSTVTAVAVEKVAPEYTADSKYYNQYVGEAHPNPMKDWLVYQVLGLFFGGFISAALSNRIVKKVEKGPRASVTMRLVFAFIGGGLMGFGAKLARGCTSGQALSGGALLNLGSWVFMMAVFAGGYLFAYFLRRQWQ
ncbi:MAG: YeeE/YedE family protein [Candidatus Kapabacteria bacterium]|nr:YeeE/YedE family protein [Ignavibacteriota bacterium]MCW5886121.1 YeeE/YedE family protein [Candidatus Kapabacteria bacterium]